MRNLILAIVPVIALTALPALAQSSASESTTTTTTAAPPPVQSNETVTKKSYSNDGSTAQQSESQHSVTTNGLGQTDVSKARTDRTRKAVRKLSKPARTDQPRNKPPTTIKSWGVSFAPGDEPNWALTKIGRKGPYYRSWSLIFRL